ncbi:hypothetical protein QQ008_26465 [Fulvivirgaceae bacterium BMA10]|uniref:Uncharacterized protein n=1 Tax=Splendidivirga corallicola TaxID=3051826 RepID=A0ABT8KYF0_9BACT|nr:hypothetical protein [Fulvivirgaceae bacterium BMA10]
MTAGTSRMPNPKTSTPQHPNTFKRAGQEQLFEQWRPYGWQASADSPPAGGQAPEI